MEMKKTLLFAAIILFPKLAACQPRGTINGTPIPDKVFDVPRASVELTFALEHKRPPTLSDQTEIAAKLHERRCGRLQAAIRETARAQQVKELAVTVTDADVAEFRKTLIVRPPETEYKWHVEHATALLAAVDALDKGQDMQTVYDTMVKPHGITEEEWAMQQIQGRTESGKKLLLAEASRPLQSYVDAVNHIDLIPGATHKKLEAAVDHHIALTDPKFAEYLAESQRLTSDPDPRKHWIEASKGKYLQDRRADFWRNATAKLQVVIKDPELASCTIR